MDALRRPARPAALTGVLALGLARAAHGDVNTAASDMELATTTADFSSADGRYQDGARRFHTLNGVATGAGAAAAVGAALLSVGVARGEIEVRATVTSGGGLLGVGVRR